MGLTRRNESLCRSDTHAIVLLDLDKRRNPIAALIRPMDRLAPENRLGRAFLSNRSCPFRETWTHCCRHVIAFESKPDVAAGGQQFIHSYYKTNISTHRNFSAHSSFCLESRDKWVTSVIIVVLLFGLSQIQ